MKRKILPLALTFLFLLFFASPALAQNIEGDQFVFGSSRTLEDGEVIKGSLIVFGGNVEISESSRVDGDLVVIGGNADVEGTITGNVEVLGGNVDLDDTAVVEGDVNAVGGHVSRAEAAVVEGQVEIERFDDDDDDGRHFGPPPAPTPPNISGVSWWFGRIANIFEEITWSISWVIGLALIGWLVAAFLPEQMQTVGDTAAQSPLTSLGIGALTAVLAGVLAFPSILLIVTICLAIVPFAAYTLFFMAILLGWIVIGQIIGERLLTSLDRPMPNFVMSTVVGVAVLTALWKMPVVGVIPIIGWMLGFIGGLFGLLVMLTGLGAVALTRFGTRPYSPGSGSTSYEPYTPPSPGSGRDRSTTAETELRAKIKAALAEADREGEGPKKDKPKPASPEPDPETPDPDTPPAEPGDDDDDDDRFKPK